MCDTMLIDGINVHVIQFENLLEFLKPNTNHYVLKSELDDENSIYYTIADGANFALLAFCIDKNFKANNVKIESNKIIEANECSGTTITLAHIIVDTFLYSVLDEYFDDEEECECEEHQKKPKKK